jgi:hypothetical protein
MQLLQPVIQWANFSRPQGLPTPLVHKGRTSTVKTMSLSNTRKSEHVEIRGSERVSLMG